MIAAAAPVPPARRRHGLSQRLGTWLPTRRSALLLALTAPVWLFSGTTAGLVAALLVSCTALLMLVADALFIPGARMVQVRRELPGTLGLGDTAKVTYRLQSAWPRPLAVELNDLLPAGLQWRAPLPADAPWRVGSLRLPPQGEATLARELTGRERGQHALGDVVLRLRGPLGLVQRTLRASLTARVAVVPSISSVRRHRLLAVQHRLREAGIRTIRRRGEGSSFANLREYVEGDDPRHIDWKACARRGKLITREYSVEQGQSVVIAVDAGRMMTQLSDGVSRFEHALAAAMVLADVATRSGDHVGLLVFNDALRAFVPPAKGMLALHRIRDALVPLEANLTEPDYAGAFRALAARHRRRSLIVLFTDVVDVRASRAVIAHTARSAARHLPLVVALKNDALVAAALPHGDGARLFESAAAEELLLERDEALTAMRRAGVSVLDVSPRVMTAAVVNRYLAIKARALL